MRDRFLRRFVIDEVGSDLHRDLFSRNIHDCHLKRAHADLETVQKLPDRLTASRGRVIYHIAVENRYLFTRGEYHLRSGAACAGDDDPVVSNGRRAVKHGGRFSVRDQIQRLCTHVRQDIERHDHGKCQKEKRLTGLPCSKPLSQFSEHVLLLSGRKTGFCAFGACQTACIS